MNIKEVFKGLSFWKKVLVAVCAVFIAVILLLLINYWYVRRQIDKGDLVEWDGRLYTKEELNKTFPPQYYEAVAKNTPEEVYMTFRQALLDNNIELALEQISDQNREKYREILKKYSDLKTLGVIYPEKIIKNHEYGNFSSYDYKFIKDGKEVNSSVEFIKNIHGYWKINNG